MFQFGFSFTENTAEKTLTLRPSNTSVNIAHFKGFLKDREFNLLRLTTGLKIGSDLAQALGRAKFEQAEILQPKFVNETSVQIFSEGSFPVTYLKIHGTPQELQKLSPLIKWGTKHLVIYIAPYKGTIRALNASVFFSKRIIRSLICANLQKLEFSFDSDSPLKAEHIRGYSKMKYYGTKPIIYVHDISENATLNLFHMFNTEESNIIFYAVALELFDPKSRWKVAPTAMFAGQKYILRDVHHYHLISQITPYEKLALGNVLKRQKSTRFYGMVDFQYCIKP